MAKRESAEKAIKDIRRKTRRRFSAEKKIRIVVPLEDAHAIRYFLDNLIRKNSPVVRAGIRVAHRMVSWNLFWRLVPYYYLIFKVAPGDRPTPEA